ncbi:universal stress protein [Streptomyces sp. NPDC088789]|uniref:universal stress protein n=1 Tax=Streptomyces sp. NPDC088789 TaxID=3365899 RepID=UPI00380B5BED
MTRPVTVGLDGSRESRAAAEWAAREARTLGAPLKLVHIREPVPEPLAEARVDGKETHRHWSERVPREAAEGLRLRHPDLEVTSGHLDGRPAELLAREAEEAELLVLGSRALGPVGGFVLGSVGLAVVARTERPVVLVRADARAADAHAPDPAGTPSAATPNRPVVLGLDTADPDAGVIGFAFRAAARRATSLRVLHAWNPPPYSAYGLAVDPAHHGSMAQQRTAALDAPLALWRGKFPEVEVVRETGYGSPGPRLVEASADASLVVVGRRDRRGPLGSRIGAVTHTVLHHATAPVAVVPHPSRGAQP